MSNVSFSKTWAAADVLYAADLEAMKAALIAVINGDIDNANIASAAAISPSKIDDYSASSTDMRVQTNPYTSDTEVLATDMRGELARIRYVLATMLGTTYWYQAANLGVAVHNTGDLKWTIKTSADTGWIMMDDGTIGETGSGASTRANDDTLALYTLVYDNFSDTLCPVTGGRGADAATDFAAGKTMRLPLVAGRVIGVSGTPAAANLTTNFSGTTTGAGNVGGTTMVLSDSQGPHTDDILLGYFVTITSGANSGETRTVSGYAEGTQTITVSSAFTAQVASGVTFTINSTVPTRTLGATVGTPTIIGTGAGQGSDVGAIETVKAFGVGGTDMTNYPPTWFGNLMVKL